MIYRLRIFCKNNLLLFSCAKAKPAKLNKSQQFRTDQNNCYMQSEMIEDK